mmetsp:Transcript_96277/g.140746  ORF Transcript_96277/g.140746 Transcript_96277/m.140746 type:complete len:210 (-) Transcript_96277:1554-2183(-)
MITSSSACSLSCPEPLVLRSARSCSSASFVSCFSCMRIYECSSNSRTHSSSASYSFFSCSNGVMDLCDCFTRACTTTRCPSSCRCSASSPTRCPNSSCTLASSTSIFSVSFEASSMALRCVRARVSRTADLSFCTSCRRASMDTSEVRSASISSSRRDRGSPVSRVSSASSLLAKVRCAMTCSVATAFVLVSMARRLEFMCSTLSWHDC